MRAVSRQPCTRTSVAWRPSGRSSPGTVSRCGGGPTMSGPSWRCCRVLEGVTVPLVTPMATGDRLDLGAIPRLLERLAEAELDAVMLGGTSGEGHALSIEALVEFTQAVVGPWRRLSGGRGRVFVTVTAPSTALALERARAVADGIDAVVLGPPYYFRYTEPELAAHYAAFADLGIPVIAYDTPRYSGNPLTLEVRRTI